MSALIGAYQRAVNRLLPYRALHTDLVAHEEYYTFNDSSATDPEDDLSQWTQGSNALTTDGSATHTYNGEASWVLRADSTPPTNDTDVYVESAATNFHTDIPCTFRVIARAPISGSVWLRVYDPNQALSDAWFHLSAGSTGDPETHSGEVGQTSVNVIEARVTYPIPGLTNLGTGGAGDSAHFMLLEMELPAAASRTMRIQVVDADADTDLDVNVLVYIARAEIRQGKVSKWTCRRTGRSFSQATAANQPYARPMGVRRFNGRRVLRFSGSQFLVSDDPASEWDFLHSGAAASVYCAYLPTTASSLRLMSTSDGASEGIRIRTDIDADTRTGVDIWNGSDTLVTSVYSSNGTTPIDALYIAGYRCQDGHADGDATLDVGGAQYTGNASTWGSSGAPTTTLHIGSENGDAAFVGYIADIAIYEARLTDDEHARAVEEFEALNASSLVIPGCIHNLVAGEVVGATWNDRSTESNNATITGTINSVASSPSFKGSPVEVFDAGERAAANGVTGDLPDLSADHAVICTAQFIALSGFTDLIWSFSNSGGSAGESFEALSGQWRHSLTDDAAATDPASTGAADLRPHTHSFVISGGERSAWVDGVPLFSGVATGLGTMTVNRFTINANAAGGLSTDTAVSEIAVYNQAPTTYQRQLVERAQRRRMLGMMSLKLGFSLGAITPAPSTGGSLTLETIFQTLIASDASWGSGEVEAGTEIVHDGWGAGGAGDTAGGGGGEHARVTEASASPPYNIAIGAGGAGPGGNTTVNSTLLVATGGGAASGATPGTGGSGGTGDATHAGGDGQAGGSGGGSGGSGTAASGATPGQPDGCPGDTGAAGTPGGGGPAATNGATGLYRATYLRKADPAFPYVVDFSFGRDTGNATSRDIVIPGSHEAGDILLCFWSSDSGACAISGWTAVTSGNNGGVLAIDGTGSEAVAMTSGTEQTGHLVLRIRNAAAIANIDATEDPTAEADVDLPSHTHGGGSVSGLWFTVATFDTADPVAVSSLPSGWNWFTLAGNGSGGAGLIVGLRRETAETVDPPALGMTYEGSVGNSFTGVVPVA